MLPAGSIGRRIRLVWPSPAQAAAEAFHCHVVRGLARTAEVQFHSPFIGPAVHGLANELATVVSLDRPWRSALPLDHVEHRHPVLPLQALPNLDGQALARVQIDHGEHAQPAPVEQRIGNTVHAPDFIDRVGERLGLAQLGRLVAAWARQAQRQALLEPVHPLDVVQVTFAAKPYVNPAVAVVHARCSDVLDAHRQDLIIILDRLVQTGRC